tara:strand:- start:421 stop:1239 length:819 start_codon:yes stop_codon:yes gene_type:complete
MLYVIGNPIKHSFSPMIHNYWMMKYGIRLKYEQLLVRKADLERVVNEVRHNKVLGLNVTLPYKVQIIPYLDSLHETARESGAVNTVYKNKQKKIEGANTDGMGFCSYLEKDKSFNFNGKSILVLGAGGSARGIISEMVKRKTLKINVMNRTEKKAFEIVEFYKNQPTQIIAEKWNTDKPFENIDLIINTTSFGMGKNEHIKLNTQKLKQPTIVIDIIYNPRQTMFLEDQREKGFDVYNGIGMLVRQAAASFNFWFNIELNKNDITEIKKRIE